jgi:hypothetical protein
VSLFALLFLLFVRFVPPIAVNEVKRLRFDLVTRRPPGGSA